MKLPRDIAVFAGRVNKACEALNDGLAAFAMALAVVVLFVGVVRASEYASAFSASAALAGQPVMGFTPGN